MTNNSKKDTHIFIFDAEPGMVISRDIFATDGKLIAGKDTKAFDFEMKAYANNQFVFGYLNKIGALKIANVKLVKFIIRQQIKTLAVFGI